VLIFCDVPYAPVMKRLLSSGPLCGLAFLLCCLILFTDGCRHQMPENTSSSPRPDINEVLQRHQPELMTLANVIGVYVGLMPDQKTPCLKVMLSRKDRATQARFPRELEGYPVVPEVTGVIRPF
jgi:hypothetical protein